MGAEVKLLCLSTTSQKIKRDRKDVPAHTQSIAAAILTWQSDLSVGNQCGRTKSGGFLRPVLPTPLFCVSAVVGI